MARLTGLADRPGRAGLPVLIAHGSLDPVIEVGFGRDAARRLEAAGLAVEYLEFEGGHHVEPSQLPAMRAWLERVTAR